MPDQATPTGTTLQTQAKVRMVENRVDQQYRAKNAELESRIELTLKQTEELRVKLQDLDSTRTELNNKLSKESKEKAKYQDNAMG